METPILKWLEGLLQLFYPKICIGCQVHLSEQEDIICLHCEHHLPKTLFSSYAKNPIEKLFWGRVPLRSAASIFFFNKGDTIQQLMHQLKYKNRKDIGLWMGRMLAKEILKSNRFDEIDWIVPVPLHPKKEFKRGYNQSLLIAKGMEEQASWQVIEALERKENTATQTRKGKFDRWLNVGSSFKINPKFCAKGKNILLVDDVLTTGATMESCIQILLKAEVASVSIAAFASA
jgi:ComF family protein